MDVRCERCGTEYEFEDTRVTEEGVTVKCSTCGHLFKIRKKSFVLTEPVTLGKKEGEDAGDRNWMVRKSDGTVLSFKELTTLQKWIVERKVSRDDEISKSGETWKRLGGIAELASFFQVVDAATTGSTPAAMDTLPMPAAAPPTAPPAHTTQPLPAAAPPSQPAVPAQPDPAMQPTATSQPAADPAMTPQAVPQSPVPVPVPPAPAPQPVQPAPAPAPQDPSHPVLPAHAPVPQAPSEPDSWGEPGFAGADDDVVEKWKKRGRRKWFIIVPLMVLVAGVGVWYLAAPESFMGVVHSITGKSDALSQAALTQYQSGRAHFLKDSQSELDLAVRDLNAAISAAEGKYPDAMALLGEVYVTRAAQNDLRINALDRKIAALNKQVKALMPPDGSEPKGEVKKQILPLNNQKVEIQKKRNILVDAARKDLDEAKRYIDAAVEIDPKAYAPKRAMADYLRVLKAGRDQVDRPLKEAQTAKPSDPELLYIEGAFYAADTSTLEIAGGKLTQAVELMPELVRARYLLAEVLIKQKKPNDAKVHLQRIVQESPDHQLATDLLATLEKPPEPEKPKVPGQPDTYEGWMQLAQKLQDREQAKKALDAYSAALELKPEDPRALTGQGYCYFDLGQLSNATKSFRQALRKSSRNGDAIIGLAEVYKDRGDNDNAIEFYERYLEVLPNGPEAALAERNIKELQ
jgi:predicted Zn finger-like uncharacterized protein